MTQGSGTERPHGPFCWFSSLERILTCGSWMPCGHVLSFLYVFVGGEGAAQQLVGGQVWGRGPAGTTCGPEGRSGLEAATLLEQ